MFRNPETTAEESDHAGAVELKHSWVVSYDGLVFGSGWYGTADEYTKSIVTEAIVRYHSDGLDSTVEYYNDPARNDGAWFAFIADGEGEIISYFNPEIVGSSIDELLGTEAFTPSASGAWVETQDTNPFTGEVASKHAWVIGMTA